MQLRQAAALHHVRYRGGLHSTASLAAAQAGMKFAALITYELELEIVK